MIKAIIKKYQNYKKEKSDCFIKIRFCYGQLMIMTLLSPRFDATNEEIEKYRETVLATINELKDLILKAQKYSEGRKLSLEYVPGVDLFCR
jgi:hypothetical protein